MTVQTNITVDDNLGEIRAALAALSALHATANLSRADMMAAVRFVEDRCTDISRLCNPAPMVTLPVLTLGQIAAQARAEARQSAGRRHHLRVVPAEGGVA